MKNSENVRKYKKDIREALSTIGIEYNDLINDKFIYEDEVRRYLDSLGLVNRGFCPLCGEEPIGHEYYKGVVDSMVVQYLCKDCSERIKPPFSILLWLQFLCFRKKLTALKNKELSPRIQFPRMLEGIGICNGCGKEFKQKFPRERLCEDCKEETRKKFGMLYKKVIYSLMLILLVFAILRLLWILLR